MRIFRIVVGALLGYILSAATSIAWFLFTHHAPTAPATVLYMALTAIYGIACSIVVGYLAARIGGNIASAYGVAFLLVFLSLWSIFESHPTHAAPAEYLWSILISMLLMAPATVVGGHLLRNRIPTG
ncbi:hypothetical protein AciPR4_3378 [Terriglobus saanensis SP1PR4]|uniref:Uncharacterized protein n=2 Tax=Terriglobus saanensis TaxID=870903 RepID=E8UXA8_TERSS|nr:hypothetical protein AciPR4_3378 [Terriglobus saanensis SP1PR4]